MQHHGCLTRLLDWTQSPLIAAFFALNKAGTRGTPVVYSIKVPKPILTSESPFEINGVRTYFPPHISPRIQAQRSVFTVHDKPSDPYEPEGLVRWIFQSNRHFLMKQILDSCGLNFGSLFPDLQGLSGYAGWLYKWGRFPEIGVGDD